MYSVVLDVLFLVLGVCLLSKRTTNTARLLFGAGVALLGTRLLHVDSYFHSIGYTVLSMVCARHAAKFTFGFFGLVSAIATVHAIHEQIGVDILNFMPYFCVAFAWFSVRLVDVLMDVLCVLLGVVLLIVGCERLFAWGNNGGLFIIGTVTLFMTLQTFCKPVLHKLWTYVEYKKKE